MLTPDADGVTDRRRACGLTAELDDTVVAWRSAVGLGVKARPADNRPPTKGKGAALMLQTITFEESIAADIVVTLDGSGAGGKGTQTGGRKLDSPRGSVKCVWGHT